MTGHAIAGPLEADVLGAPSDRRIEWAFRAGIAACFIGHGAFGVMTKTAWLPYFATFGIGADAAFAIMPLVGLADIAMGLIGLFTPRRVILVYMSVWAFWTAALRPLAGESVWEMVERAGNYGVPLAFLLAVGVANPRRWLEVTGSSSRRLAMVGAPVVRVVLWATTVAVLLGRGALDAHRRGVPRATDRAPPVEAAGAELRIGGESIVQRVRAVTTNTLSAVDVVREGLPPGVVDRIADAIRARQVLRGTRSSLSSRPSECPGQSSSRSAAPAACLNSVVRRVAMRCHVHSA